MPRGCRSDLPDGIYHVTGRGTGGIYVFMDDVDRARFTVLLREAAQQFDLQLIAWCLLGTHFHLIVDSRREQLSRAMHRLNGLYAQRFNNRHARRGHLFEERFSSWVIETEEHLHRAIEYVIENPVAAGLCSRPEEWIWSWPRLDSPSFSDIRGTVPGTWSELAG